MLAGRMFAISLNTLFCTHFEPPSIGDLRLRHPIPVGPYSGYHNATAFGFSCPQQTLVLPSALPPELDLDVTTRIINTIYDPSLSQSEDCKSIFAANIECCS